jgi:ABC-2 type transport system ATP-binding protein
VLLRAGRVVADGSVSATVPSPDLAGLESLPGVSGVRVEGSRIHLSCDDSDLALRALLAAEPAAADVEIVAHGLEDAFVKLTEGV